MKRYRCKKGFVVDSYDGDGFLIPNKEKVVEIGDIYSIDQTGSTIVGGEVHLDAEDGSWLELSRKSLEEYFELYKD